MIRIAVDAVRPDAAGIERAAAEIRAGHLAAIPTDTLYGLAADPFNGTTVARLFAVKGRDADRALPLVAADAGQVTSHFGELPELARRLAGRFWPGPLTLLLDAPRALAPLVSGGTSQVGVRVPAHAVTVALCRACGGPLTATSANISGSLPTDDPDLVARALGDLIDLLVDAGPTPGGAPSTVVDASGREPRLIRAGAIPWDEVRACLDLA
ncbi:MAG: threonylcarbamoyl-AMP synthase [Luteitalea sp.]|nr:threonylcarbamoyl-AMP synthase [Luteitalea sp.]